MIRIAALNEESHSSGSEDEDEPTVTKEAQVNHIPLFVHFVLLQCFVDDVLCK